MNFTHKKCNVSNHNFVIIGMAFKVNNYLNVALEMQYSLSLKNMFLIMMHS